MADDSAVRSNKPAAPAHKGMSDQTSTNVARDGAAKKVQSSVPVKWGMTDQTDASKLSASPAHPGFGDDADPGSIVTKPGNSGKSTPTPKTAWGMKGENDASLGSKVLSEAASLGK